MSVLILERQQFRAQQIRLGIGWRHPPLKACPTWALDPQQIALRRPLVGVPLDEAAKLSVDAHREPLRHSRRKYTGPQQASLGVPSAARTSSHRARAPTA